MAAMNYACYVVAFDQGTDVLLEELEHDPEKCVAVFPRDKRVAFARRSCSIKKLKRDDDST
jgi:hypothetical protein